MGGDELVQILRKLATVKSFKALFITFYGGQFTLTTQVIKLPPLIQVLNMLRVECNFSRFSVSKNEENSFARAVTTTLLTGSLNLIVLFIQKFLQSHETILDQ